MAQRGVEHRRPDPPPASPLEEMSYAIQDAPWQPWPQPLSLTSLVVLGLVSLFWK
ncbi:hypothetical protein [Mycobacterium sp. Lab-001]|uniref:hypothetical protein n=1 Tax=Mycobacterium sp. Lab-001 TaxID=3410136 RepID=UPI003D16F637